MACMEARRALKSSLLGEINYVQEQNMSFAGYDDDVLNVGVVGSGEDFHVEELFDFSNGEFQEEEEEEGGVVEEEEEEEEEEKDSNCVVSQDYCLVDDDDNSNYSTSLSSNLDSQSLLDTELGVPMDHIEELEWVSLMVEDTMPDSLLCPAFGKEKTENCAKTRSEPVFPSRFPVKSRTKRPRSSRFGKQQLLMSPTSESSSTSSCSSGHSSVSCLTVTNNMVPSMVCVTGPSEPEKKKKKPNHSSQTGAFQFQRRCSHCGVQKTPQWRTGPMGAKTLCNACGVRYKSGRLFPEYRPACSPHFSVEFHSNSHRKVLEMRKKKEMFGVTSGSIHVEPIF